MNLLRICGATLLIAMAVGMSACKSEEAPVPTPTPTTSEETAGEKKISFTANIEGLPDDDLRLMVQNTMVGNKHAGLKFTWKPGET